MIGAEGRPASGDGQPVRRIVVLRALGLGDLLTAVPALRGLRAAYPDAEITLAGPTALAELLALTGAVDAVHLTAPLTPLDPVLHGADLAVNLHGCGPQSTRALLASKPRRLLAYAHEEIPETAGMPQWARDEHEVRRWCRLLGVPADPALLALTPPSADPARSGAIVVHPGAALPSRRWPLERWGEVVAGLVTDGHRVLLTGGPDEVDVAEQIAGRAGGEVLAGRTTTLQLASVVAAARLVVCPDTGVGHLATATGTPSVLLFGPSDPARWGPPPALADRHRVLWAGRTGDPFADTVDPGLLELAAAQVLDACRTQLAMV